MSKKVKEKKLKNKNSNKINLIITILLLFIVLFMGTGYALLTEKIDIFGKAKIKITDFRIYISNIKVLTKNGGYETKNPTFQDKQVGLYSTLPKKGDSVTYEVTLTNSGMQSAVIDSILPINDNPQIKYKIIGINNLDTIKGNSERKFKIIVEHSENSDGTSKNSSILFDFNFVKLSSFSNNCTSNWDGATVSQPLTYNFNGDVYYQINNASEFKWFTNEISSGNNNIKGMLKKNICLGNNSIDKIYATGTFNGILDGQNRSISGGVFNRTKEISEYETFNIGLFINNSGLIRNLNVNLNYTDSKTVAAPSRFGVSRLDGNINIGGIVVHNSGIIENSSFSGSITENATLRSSCVTRGVQSSDYIGGIASKNSGIIRGCNNIANLKTNDKSVYSRCNIYDRIFYTYVGGISADNTGFITDSYNSGNITMTATHQSDTRSYYNGYLGAVTANNANNTSNVYSHGNVTHTPPDIGYNKDVTGIISTNTGTINNVYYLDGGATNNIGTLVTDSDLKNLSGNVKLGNGFKIKPNGYPLLYWQ